MSLPPFIQPLADAFVQMQEPANVQAYLVSTIVVVVTAVLLIVFKTLTKKKVALDPETWKAFQLVAVEKLSHDVKRFRFELPTADTVLGLPIGQHISLKFIDDEGKEVMRSYTPVTSNDEKGYVDFVVKIYHKCERFPNGGKMSLHLDSLKIGQSMEMRGPKGHLEYMGHGHFQIKKRGHIHHRHAKHIGMVAGGTGITPMLQIIHAILKDPSDKTEMWLLFANQTEEDILLRKELEAIPKNRLHLHYTLDRPGKDWKYSSGFINKEMCRFHLPPAGNSTFIMVCGPPPMIKYACEPAFKELGIDEHMWLAF